MPFKSKSQQRLLFAKNPEKAREWAHETKNIKGLPEKKHPEVNPKRDKLPGVKIASEGLFFEKRSQPSEGHFFRDMPGRDDATFHEKAAQLGGGMNVGTMNAGATGAPIGGSGQRGMGMGGGMYGAGEGTKDSKETKAKQSDADRLKELLGKAVAQGGGEERAAPRHKSEEKTAGKTPSDWDADGGMPTGFHRPTQEQPESLEAGGTRFHSTEAKGPDYGAGEGMSHGLVEAGKLRMKGTSGSQMGKHASTPHPSSLGISFGLAKTAGAGGYAAERGGEFKGSLGRAGSAAASRVDEGAKAITRSPLASVIAAALAAGYLGRRTKGLGKVIKKGYGRVRHGKVPQEKSLAEKVVGGAKSAVGSIGAKLGLTTR